MRDDEAPPPSQVKGLAPRRDFLKRWKRVAFWALLIQSVQLPLTTAQGEDGDGPNLSDSLTYPLLVSAGRSAALTCVVRNLGRYSVIWKDGRGELLTAGQARVTEDERFNVVHDDGGDVYVLTLEDVKTTDSGVFTCEVNTKPPTRSFHKLTVLPVQLVAPGGGNATGRILPWESSPTPSHDFTKCCRNMGVRRGCLGFCSVENILEGSAGAHPDQCEEEFPKVVECMAAGRNHVPCCQEAMIPDVCQDMCTGSYTVRTDDARSHLSCFAFTRPTLVCIAEGVDILPPQPTELTADDVTEASFVLNWSVRPFWEEGSVEQEALDTPPIENFTVSVEQVRTMTDDSRRHPMELKANTNRTINVPGTKTAVLINDLIPYTLYNVSMIANNVYGRSLPSFHLLVLTLSRQEAKLIRQQQKALKKDDSTEEEASFTTPSPIDVPSIKQCCRNVPNKTVHDSCIDKFCDPTLIKNLEVIDFMLCASWTWDMFACLSDGKNHQPCCRRRGVPDECNNFCSGNATAESFTHKQFKCQNYMSEISNCFIEDYGLLPSEPRSFHFSNVGTNIGLLHWDPPLLNGKSVKEYRVHVEKSIIYPRTKVLGGSKVRTAESSPYVVEGLRPGTSYIAYVEARNEYGVGPASSIALFRTAHRKTSSSRRLDLSAYDQKLCCRSAGVKDECLNLCQYNASISEAKRSSALCKEDFHRITKCQAAGRDHLPCCERRGVPSTCQSLCQGTQSDPNSSVYGNCFTYIGNIMTCFEDGVLTLPEPVRNFHAQRVGDTKVTFAWDKQSSPKDNDTKVNQFEIYYKELGNNSKSANAFDYERNINVTTAADIVTIAGLKPNVRHQFFVVARNKYGTSLPSSLITVVTNGTLWNGQAVSGKPSPPHEVTATSGTDYILVSWTAPSISSPEDYHKYRLTYRPAINDSIPTSVETSSTSVKLQPLFPNTRYIMYIETIQVDEDGKNEESEPSETLIAWTTPLVGAAVDRPIIMSNNSIEGENFKILCNGFGSPMPTLTLYVDGHAIRSEEARHLLTTLHNVTRSMRKVGCSAENFKNRDYKEIALNVRYKPSILSIRQSANKTRKDGKAEFTHTVTCSVQSRPPPTIRFGRNDGKDLAISSTLQGDVAKEHDQSSGRRIDVYIGDSMSPGAMNRDDIFEAVLKIQDVNAGDAASYYCSAENDLGKSKEDFNIPLYEMETLPRHDNMRQCCERENVQSQCLDICTFRLDADLLSMEASACNSNFAAYMKCGSDDSDHRHCCQQKGVPPSCLDFCRGRAPLPEVLNIDGLDGSHCWRFMKEMSQCFQEGQYTLPGPPRNIRVTPVSATSAVATWDPPVKNPDNVQLYRIIWRQPGKSLPYKIDTPDTNVTLFDLQPEATYELVVKSGNPEGTSVLSPPITFVTADKYIVTTKSEYVYVDTGSLVGGLLSIIIILGIGIFLFFWMKGSLPWKRPSLSIASSPSRSFDNPFYNQEVTMSDLEARRPSQTRDEGHATAGEEPSSARTAASRLADRLKWPLGASGIGFQRFE